MKLIDSLKDNSENLKEVILESFGIKLANFPLSTKGQFELRLWQVHSVLKRLGVNADSLEVVKISKDETLENLIDL